MTWKDEYRAAMAAFVMTKGRVLSTNDRDVYYGAYADDEDKVRTHLRWCAPDKAMTAISEAEWSEFTDTENDPDEKRGVDATVTCECGRVAGRAFRFEGTLHEILMGVLEED